MPEPTTAVAKADKEMIYVPFGSTEEIKLNIHLVKTLICVKTKQGLTCSDDDAVKFLMMCKARLLNPFEGDAFLIGYDSQTGPKFSLITAHQAFLKRAEMNKEYDGMESGVIVELEDGKLSDLPGDFHTPKQRVVGGWATVYFKNRKFPMHKRIRLSRFQKAFGVWQDDPAGMICKCAEADALRSSFPTMLGGLYLREETEHEPVSGSAPIFKEPPLEAEVVVEAPKPPPASAPPPVVPLPKPKAAKPPPPAPTPPEPAKSEIVPVLDVLKQRLAAAGITPKQMIQSLIELGSISDQTITLEQVALESQDVIDMVYNNFDDFVERIKGS